MKYIFNKGSSRSGGCVKDGGFGIFEIKDEYSNESPILIRLSKSDTPSWGENPFGAKFYNYDISCYMFEAIVPNIDASIVDANGIPYNERGIMMGYVEHCHLHTDRIDEINLADFERFNEPRYYYSQRRLNKRDLNKKQFREYKRIINFLEKNIGSNRLGINLAHTQSVIMDYTFRTFFNLNLPSLPKEFAVFDNVENNDVYAINKLVDDDVELQNAVGRFYKKSALQRRYLGNHIFNRYSNYDEDAEKAQILSCVARRNYLIEKNFKQRVFVEAYNKEVDNKTPGFDEYITKALLNKLHIRYVHQYKILKDRGILTKAGIDFIKKYPIILHYIKDREYSVFYNESSRVDKEIKHLYTDGKKNSYLSKYPQIKYKHDRGIPNELWKKYKYLISTVDYAFNIINKIGKGASSNKLSKIEAVHFDRLIDFFVIEDLVSLATMREEGNKINALKNNLVRNFALIYAKIDKVNSKVKVKTKVKSKRKNKLSNNDKINEVQQYYLVQCRDLQKDLKRNVLDKFIRWNNGRNVAISSSLKLFLWMLLTNDFGVGGIYYTNTKDNKTCIDYKKMHTVLHKINTAAKITNYMNSIVMNGIIKINLDPMVNNIYAYGTPSIDKTKEVLRWSNSMLRNIIKEEDNNKNFKLFENYKQLFTEIGDLFKLIKESYKIHEYGYSSMKAEATKYFNAFTQLKGLNKIKKLRMSWDRRQNQINDIRQKYKDLTNEEMKQIKISKLPGLDLAMEKIKRDKTIFYKATFLDNQLKLINEGARQSHCVSVYFNRCLGFSPRSVRVYANEPEQVIPRDINHNENISIILSLAVDRSKLKDLKGKVRDKYKNKATHSDITMELIYKLKQNSISIDEGQTQGKHLYRFDDWDRAQIEKIRDVFSSTINTKLKNDQLKNNKKLLLNYFKQMNKTQTKLALLMNEKKKTQKQRQKDMKEQLRNEIDLIFREAGVDIDDPKLNISYN